MESKHREMKLPIPEIRGDRFPYIIDTDVVEIQLALEEYAKRVGRGELSEAEKRQAWLLHVLEKYGS